MAEVPDGPQPPAASVLQATYHRKIATDDDNTPAGPAPEQDAVTFSILVRDEGERIVVAPQGEVDLATIDRVAAALRDADGPFRLLDLRAVTFLDTSGLRMVLDQHLVAEREGRRFALIAGPPLVQRLFDIAGLSGRLEFLTGTDVPEGDGPPG